VRGTTSNSLPRRGCGSEGLGLEELREGKAHRRSLGFYKVAGSQDEILFEVEDFTRKMRRAIGSQDDDFVEL
jgi:hypothetical protein